MEFVSNCVKLRFHEGVVTTFCIFNVIIQFRHFGAINILYYSLLQMCNNLMSIVNDNLILFF
jgi:hypothetical protein